MRPRRASDVETSTVRGGKERYGATPHRPKVFLSNSIPSTLCDVISYYNGFSSCGDDASILCVVHGMDFYRNVEGT